MYLTRMKLDITQRKTMMALASPVLFHGMVEDAFSGSRQRNLWRVDRLNGGLVLLILSPEVPNLKAAVRQFGCPEDSIPWETKDYQPLLDRITAGSAWQFRLTANPTVSRLDKTKSKEEREHSKVMAHITPQHQKEWLLQRAEKNGFSLAEDEFDVVRSQWYKFKDKQRSVTLLGVTYEGVLQVTEKERFIEALTTGIGREKAFGMGLLTVMSCR